MAALNPAQRDVLDQLGARRDERPEFDAELRHELRHELESGIGPAIAALDDDGTALWISKRKLAQIHRCEAHYLAEDDGKFRWSVPAARGTVAHKAIETAIHWRRELVPLSVVDEALARLEEGTDDLGRFLQGCREIERAELRAAANERLVKFLECWPPLQGRWRPAVESRVRFDLLDERVALAGKVDLQLGHTDGLVAGKVIVDFKTGAVAAAHLDDLRFYALIETLRNGVPPRRIATYYLDQGRFLPEDITIGALRTTVARVVDGVVKMVELKRATREPKKATGPACRWCIALSRCDEGQRATAAGDPDSFDETDDW